MSEQLDRLAEAHGVELAYISETGERQLASEAAKRGVLAAMGVHAETEDDIRASLAAAPAPVAMTVPADARCFVPEWLGAGRAWGITCQLYSLRSARNWGIGDFEDLAVLAELAASAGADFLGVNPLHALFLADPARCSPYSPSTRRFLHPLYIAVDRLGEECGGPADELAAVRRSKLVDYRAVARLKRAALEKNFLAFRRHHLETRTQHASSFEAFCRERGTALEDFALYEALSEWLVEQDYPCGWQLWPEAYRDRDSGEVRRFREEHAAQVLFHTWLQWIADLQLAAAQRRARAAGMRIGLYLDLAVGVAPDGAATWSDRDLVVPGARIGAPPDSFNHHGQDWGLAPLSPAALRARNVEPFEAVIADLMRHAGAIRIDHAMGLMRLYWIPAASKATDGAYVRYPMAEMMRLLSAASVERRVIVIGEDLGTVPPGFREIMRQAEIQSYRVLYFERGDGQRFLQPHAYPKEACACISTHDLPTLAGWWRGADIDARERLGLSDAAASARQRTERERDRRLLLAALAEAGLLPGRVEGAATGDEALPHDLDARSIAALHAFLARAPSRLVAVQLEDLTGAVDQANLPGTFDEYPNWLRKLPVEIEEIGGAPLFETVTSALARERPRQP